MLIFSMKGGDPDDLPPAGNDRGKKGVVLLIEVSVRDGSMELQGHADYQEKGKDIVCAAVSVLVQTLRISLQEFTNDQADWICHKGYMKMEYKDLSERGRLLMDSFFIGICGIASAYPTHIQIR